LHKNNIGPHLNIRNYLYEDTLRDIKIKVGKKKYQSFVSKLDLLTQSLSFLCSNSASHKELADFFLKNFDQNEEVNVLTFYEKYYAAKVINQFKAELNEKEEKDKSEKEEDEVNDVQVGVKVGIVKNKKKKLPDVNVSPVENKPIMSEHALEVANQTYRYCNSISALIDKHPGLITYTDGCCSISEDFLHKLNAEFTGVQHYLNPSYSAFVQFCSEDNDTNLKGVVNVVLPGYGKYMGRFMHLFEESLTNEIIQWNKEQEKENEIFAENTDASFFNANLHPWVLSQEIELPGGHNRLDKEHRIQVADLFIKYEDNKLVLYAKKLNKTVQVLDLGFQSLMGRSKLYQLLCEFGKNNFFNLNALLKIFNERFGTEIPIKNRDEKITYNPRIIFADSIILQRKKWYIPISSMKDFIGKKNDDLLYVKIQEWRYELTIPDEIFIRSKFNVFEGQNRDDYKPQYIDFRSPLSIKLLVRILNKVEKGYIQIEEMLPGSNQLLKFGHEQHVSEFLVQW
jgi:hypothetical protein